MVYTPIDKSYKTLEDVKSDESYKTISGTELRKILDSGDEIPQWFSYPEVANELKNLGPLNKRASLYFYRSFWFR